MAGCKPLYLALTPLFLLAACVPMEPDPPEVHGHRGCRGLEPENTVKAFERAAELGCDWLEMDVVITGDGEVLVSHEPWMDHRICRTPKGDSLTEAVGRGLNIYQMSLLEAQTFDCGSATHPDFPDQDSKRLYKPTLREVVESVEEKAMEKGWGQFGYNIEIKSDPALYGTYQPEPERFVELVLHQVDSLMIGDHTIIQSFDPAILEAVHESSPGLSVALLVDNEEGIEANLTRLSFVPDYYSPHFKLADAALLKDLGERNIDVLVWTVNEKEDMRRMMKLGVNGIITDYPDRLIKLLAKEE